jgi:hypothetical protein
MARKMPATIRLVENAPRQEKTTENVKISWKRRIGIGQLSVVNCQ